MRLCLLHKAILESRGGVCSQGHLGDLLPAPRHQRLPLPQTMRLPWP